MLWTAENHHPSYLCAGDPPKDTCQGDSGGPLLQYSDSGVLEQVGITSWGPTCGLTYTVYSRLSYLRPWIEFSLSVANGSVTATTQTTATTTSSASRTPSATSTTSPTETRTWVWLLLVRRPPLLTQLPSRGHRHARPGSRALLLSRGCGCVLVRAPLLRASC
ncbi:trypsin-like cysteine/serine peptidase domain-containing protein [Hyaloraphidium curvatum]|nr:trypsin-like cysteine/serine peptidase domain-containing protein [Hyaloraphidium curvatum]